MQSLSLHSFHFHRINMGSENNLLPNSQWHDRVVQIKSPGRIMKVSENLSDSSSLVFHRILLVLITDIDPSTAPMGLSYPMNSTFQPPAASFRGPQTSCVKSTSSVDLFPNATRTLIFESCVKLLVVMLYCLVLMTKCVSHERRYMTVHSFFVRRPFALNPTTDQHSSVRIASSRL
uniref:Uncharacterized protein n=1 Tax=Schistocephalus solidus TaxID=70667 RepID=A0A0X3P6V4_SCHSO